MDDTSERLVRVETKLDALIQLNDTRIQHLEKKVVDVERNLEKRIDAKASNEDFKLVRTVVFGFVALVLVAVASALIATVVMKAQPNVVKAVAHDVEDISFSARARSSSWAALTSL